MMMDAGKPEGQRKYKSGMDCWRTVAAKEGPRAFMHGALANTVRGSGAALVLVLYDVLQKFLNPHAKSHAGGA